jgi:hypothetical protein
MKAPRAPRHRVSESLNPRYVTYQSTVASGLGELTTKCERRSGIDSRSSITRKSRVATSEETSTT